MTHRNVKPIYRTQYPTLAHVAGYDADGIRRLVERLIIVRHVLRRALNAPSPGKVYVRILLGHLKHPILVAKRVGHDHVKALLGVLAQHPGHIPFSDALRRCNLDPLRRQRFLGIPCRFVPRIVVVRPRQNRRQADPFAFHCLGGLRCCRRFGRLGRLGGLGCCTTGGQQQGQHHNCRQ